jgi:hypothetical protein
MKRDSFNRPVCLGSGGPTRPCNTPVHPGYVRCYRCDRLYTREQIDAALEHPQNASFRKKEPCRCRACRIEANSPDVQPVGGIMIVCPKCGNKRCPHADDHRNECTANNAAARWRVGKACDPLPEDKTYGDERAAIEKATTMADAYGFNTAIAVWNERDDIVHLFLCGQQFRSV